MGAVPVACSAAAEADSAAGSRPVVRRGAPVTEAHPWDHTAMEAPAPVRWRVGLATDPARVAARAKQDADRAQRAPAESAALRKRQPQVPGDRARQPRRVPQQAALAQQLREAPAPPDPAPGPGPPHDRARQLQAIPRPPVPPPRAPEQDAPENQPAVSARGRAPAPMAPTPVVPPARVTIRLPGWQRKETRFGEAPTATGIIHPTGMRTMPTPGIRPT